MKATDLYKLVTERDDSSMGKVSYKNDKTPDNHVKGKKTKEVNPLPDTGRKRDERNPANIGDIKKKERRSMEGPRTGAKSVTEREIDPRIPRHTMKGPAGRPDPRIKGAKRPVTHGYGVQELEPEEIVMKGGVKPRMGSRNVAAEQEGDIDPRIPQYTMGGLDPRIPQITMKGGAKQDPTANLRAHYANKIKNFDKKTGTAVIQGPRGENVQIQMDPNTLEVKLKQLTRARDRRRAEDTYQELLRHQTATPGAAGRAAPGRRPAHSGKSVGRAMSPSQIAQAGSDWALEGKMTESGVDNAGSMSKKQTVKQGGPCCKTASVRSAKQNDEPKPTANVGKPKSKEKRSMDANNAPVKDFKGGENEHKTMGMHEGIKELEQLLQRKIRTPLLD